MTYIRTVTPAETFTLQFTKDMFHKQGVWCSTGTCVYLNKTRVKLNSSARLDRLYSTNVCVRKKTIILSQACGTKYLKVTIKIFITIYIFKLILYS